MRLFGCFIYPCEYTCGKICVEVGTDVAEVWFDLAVYVCGLNGVEPQCALEYLSQLLSRFFLSDTSYREPQCNLEYLPQLLSFLRPFFFVFGLRSLMAARGIMTVC